MKEYIEREALMGKQWECRIADIDGETYGDLRDIADFIAEFPAADVVERKRGAWVRQDDYFCCPDCGQSISELCVPWFNFCPNCGADMREVDHAD